MYNKKDIEKIYQIIDYVMTYASESTNWLMIKKEILWICNNNLRTYFSRRHFSTKKHIINALESELIDYWERKTGIRPLIPENMLHNPNLVRKEKGWGLKLFNIKRQERLKKAQNNVATT